MNAVKSNPSGAFVTVLNASASKVLFSSVLGGGDFQLLDSGSAIALDSTGNLYVAGVNASTSSSYDSGKYFPTTPGAYQTGCGDLNTCNGGT